MATTKSFFSENEDIMFHLRDKLSWQTLFELCPPEDLQALEVTTAEEYRDSWLQMLDVVGEVSANTLAPNAPKVDREDLRLEENGDVTLPPSLQENMNVMREVGIPGLGVATKYGGLGAPFVVEVSSAEIVARACPSTYLNVVWFSPVAHIIEQFGDDAVKQESIAKLGSGEWSGSMALTEADAGSDLAAMRSYGERQGDGSWRLYGSKRFISNGCGDVSLVLAKNGRDAEGLKGLNLFYVRRKNEDGSPNYMVSKLEEKVALHGSATCELQFEGSTATLLGKEGEGFPYMLRLMNDARIAVALQGLGLMEGAYRLAADFAAERRSWGKPIAKHELIAQMLLDIEVDTKAFRSLCYQAAYYQSVIYCGERALKLGILADEKRPTLEADVAKAKKLVRKWTPLIKWWVGEKSVEQARKGLQIHGGYGFSKEYRAEWFLRESLILSIYEGTSQIQGLMCVKDTMKEIIRHPREFVETALGSKVQALRPGSSLRKQLSRCRQLVSAALVSLLFKLVKTNVRAGLSEVKASDLIQVVKMLSKDLVKFENISPALLHAERICEMKALMAMAHCVVRDAELDGSRSWIAERFLGKANIRMQTLKAEIDWDDKVVESRFS